MPFYERLQAAGFVPNRPRRLVQHRRGRAAQAAASGHGRRLCGMELFPVDRPAGEPRVRPAIQDEVRRRPRDQRRDGGGIQQRLALGPSGLSKPAPTDIPDVLRAIRRQSLNAPEGIVSVDDETQHTWRPVYVGKDPERRPVRSRLELGEADPADPVSASRIAGGVGRVSRQSAPNWGGWANPGPGAGTRRGSGDDAASGPSATSETRDSRTRTSGWLRPRDKSSSSSILRSFRCNRP